MTCESGLVFLVKLLNILLAFSLKLAERDANRKLIFSSLQSLSNSLKNKTKLKIHFRTSKMDQGVAVASINLISAHLVFEKIVASKSIWMFYL